ncbi:MAG: prepilin-type N-terminal cleavage/methylation domain-containing protein [Gallionella sp.]
MKRNQSGFTLIEIAIVLVIIGLLLGGVLKGQELINSAKVKNLAIDFKNIPVFIYGYQDRFKALPGDDVNVEVHLGTSADPASTPATSIGNGTINGTWDSITPTDESVLFWQHVRIAGLTSGQQNVTVTSILDPYFPINAVGGRIGIQGNLDTTAAPRPIAGIPGTYVICSAGIAGKFARQLDITLDDGNSETGSMRATEVAAGTAAVVPGGQPTVAIAAATDDDTLYTICMGV